MPFCAAAAQSGHRAPKQVLPTSALAHDRSGIARCSCTCPCGAADLQVMVACRDVACARRHWALCLLKHNRAQHYLHMLKCTEVAGTSGSNHPAPFNPDSGRRRAAGYRRRNFSKTKPRDWRKSVQELAMVAISWLPQLHWRNPLV